MPRLKLIAILATLVILPFLARFPYFTGLRQQIPLGNFANIQQGGEVGPGQPTLESNMGFTAQALGTQAARRWTEGRVPLWNYYEGTGVPLAGEMQSAALFLPFILLLKSPDGQLLFHLSLQIVAGLSTFFFLRRLRLLPLAAACGAVFFEFNGTFAWMANAAYNPVAFLPLSLLGVELLLAAAQRGARGGWTVLCAGATWSVYAGFPEVAYVDALFVVLYTLVRLTQLSLPEVRRAALKLAVATVITLLLIAPLVAQFTDYLSFSYSDGRSTSGGASIDPRLGVAPLLVPYIFGPLFGLILPYWGKAAGYLGYSLLVLSLAAVAWQWRNRIVQFCTAWAVLALLKIYGESHVTAAFLKVPLLDMVVLQRWLMPSLEFTGAVLAAMALQELFSRRRSGLIIPALLGLGAVGWALWAEHELGIFDGLRALMVIYPTINLLFVVVFSAVCLAAVLLRRAAPWLIAGLALAEAVVLFTLPVFSAPRNCRFDWAGIGFLQKHLGPQRMYTLGPVFPNYGSAFDIAQLNYDDMPIDRDLVDYFQDHLDPFRNATNTKPDWQRGPNPRNIQIIRQNYHAYAEIGVKYVLTYSWESLADLFPEVYHSEVMRIYELPNVRPYFSADRAEVESQGREQVRVRSDHPVTLIRLESYSPNWKATIDGRPARVIRYHKLFQAVELPPGDFQLTFSYSSPHGALLTPLFWLAALLFAATGLLELGSALSPALRQRTGF